MSDLASRVFELFHVKSGTKEKNGRIPLRTLVLGIKYYYTLFFYIKNVEAEIHPDAKNIPNLRLRDNYTSIELKTPKSSQKHLRIAK